MVNHLYILTESKTISIRTEFEGGGDGGGIQCHRQREEAVYLPLIGGLQLSQWILEPSRQIPSIDRPVGIRTKDSWLGPFKGQVSILHLITYFHSSVAEKMDSCTGPPVFKRWLGGLLCLSFNKLLNLLMPWFPHMKPEH